MQRSAVDKVAYVEAEVKQFPISLQKYIRLLQVIADLQHGVNEP